MTARTWQAGDRVAERDGDTWWLGTVVDIDRDLLAIRFDGGERAGFRLANSSRHVALDDVPIDERHWLPAEARDQLVRQEAARRLRAFADALTVDTIGATYLREIADDLDEPLVEDPAALAAAARGLLNPASQPATQ